MGWPNNYVQGVYDSSGKVVGVEDGAGGQIGLAASYTWATKPTASSYIGTVFISDIGGGTYWVSNGTRWKPLNGVCNYWSNNGTYTILDVTRNSGALTLADVVYTIPLEIGMWEDGDFLELKHQIYKVGVSDTLGIKIFTTTDIGTLTEGNYLGVDMPLSAAQRRLYSDIIFMRESATTISVITTTSGIPAASSTAYSANTYTLPASMDTTKIYLQFTAYRSTVVATTDDLEIHFSKLRLNSAV